MAYNARDEMFAKERLRKAAMLTKTDLEALCSDAVFKRAQKLWRDGDVFDYTEEWLDDECVIAHATVLGSHYDEYSVMVQIDEASEWMSDWHCTCLAYENYSSPCKHCIALSLEYLSRQGNRGVPQRGMGASALGTSSSATSALGTGLARGEAASSKRTSRVKTSQVVEQLIYSYATDSGSVMLIGRKEWIEIAPELSVEYSRGYFSEELSLRVGADKKYVVKNISDFLHAFAYGQSVRYGKDLEFVHRTEALTPHAREVLAFLRHVAATQNVGVAVRGGWDAKGKIGRSLPLAQQDICDFYDLMMGRTFTFVDKGDRYGTSGKRTLTCTVREGDPSLPCRVDELAQGGFEIKVPSDFTYCHRESQLYVRLGVEVFRCSEKFSRDMLPFFLSVGDRLPSMSALSRLVVSQEDAQSFCAAVLPTLREHTLLKAAESLAALSPALAAFSFYLDKQDGLVTCTANVAYGDADFNLCEPIMQGDLFRNLRDEGKVMALLCDYFTNYLPADAGLCLPADDIDLVAALLDEGVAALALWGDVFLSDALQRMTVRQAPTVAVGVSLESGLLDIRVAAEGLDFAELRAYLDSFRRKRKFHKLANGDIVRVDEDGLRGLSDMLEGLDVGLDEIERREGELQVPAYRSLFVNATLRDEAGVSFSRNAAFRDLVRAFDEFDEAEFEAPTELADVLRPYQVIGFRWLSLLGRLGFGGVLADDMGLGKTLQAIAYMVSEKRRAKGAACGASLVVAPASLVYNWMDELARFAPDLRAAAVVGTKRERTDLVRDHAAYDVLVTSYDLLKRDVDAYEGVVFASMFADEAHYIKNPATKSAKAVKSVTAHARFALTGTPIENRLSELWSIFDYLMPGLLESRQRFERRYERPITTGKDEDAARRLQAVVKPFVLRRLKGEVLADLPEKTEIAVRSHMGDAQRKLYDAVATQLKLTLEKQLPEEFQRGRIAVLAELTKLRQICCDPHLVYDNYEGGAAKLETCMELMANAVEGGHKVLLFSQFTSMLDILKGRLDAAGVVYHVLTGATPKEKRAELVRSFSTDDVPVFLISLKAGGTGLNLTAADIVIHYDPWWNVAVQDQATDRAHRIGQDKRVSVFKIIAEDSIEEKIAALQESKRDLAERVLGGTAGASALTREDLLALL